MSVYVLHRMEFHTRCGERRQRAARGGAHFDTAQGKQDELHVKAGSADAARDGGATQARKRNQENGVEPPQSKKRQIPHLHPQKTRLGWLPQAGVGEAGERDGGGVRKREGESRKRTVGGTSMRFWPVQAIDKVGIRQSFGLEAGMRLGGHRSF
jgi:hypothetical protein